MKKIEWTIEERDVKDLLPADYNPRRMTDQERKDLEASIDEFGSAVPLVVNIGKRDNILIGGHQRASIYLDKGITKTKVAVPNRELTMAEEKKLNLRLNKNTGGWDFEKLGAIDLETLVEVGFGEEELSTLWDDVDMIEDSFNVNRAMKEIVTPKTKKGTVYQLGDHRLMCGDGTSQEDIDKLLGKTKPTILYMDPPRPVKKKKEEYDIPLRTMDAIELFMAPNSHVFIWTHDTILPYIVNTLSGDFDHKATLVWIFERITINPKVPFTQAYQPCIYGTIGATKVSSKEKTTNVLNKEVGGDNHFHDDVVAITTMWLDSPLEIREDKPVTLAEKPLKRCSTPGDSVYVPFGRAGSMLIACEQIKRKAFVMESDPLMCDVIVNRWETFTNKRAKKV